LLYVEGGSADEFPVFIFAEYTGGTDHAALFSTAQGINAALNIGISGRASKGDANVGVKGGSGTLVSDFDPEADGFLYVGLGGAGSAANGETSTSLYLRSNGSGTGVLFGAWSKSTHLGNGEVIGSYIEVSSVSGVVYIGQFKDGNEAIGKVIKSITADGKAQWSNVLKSEVTEVVEQDVTTSYTFTDADHGKIIELNNAGAIALTLNTGLRSDFAVTYVQKGAGQVTISGTATLNNIDGFLVTEGQHTPISVIPSTTADNYTIAGRLVP